MDPNTPTLAPTDDTQRADASDGGWSVESFSAPSTPAPEDTTVDPHGIDNEPTPDAAAADATAITPAPTRPSAKPAAKKKQTFQERIDEITGQRHEAERRANEALQRAQELERRLIALEKGTTPAPAAAAPASAGTKPAALPALREMPEPPKYADFVTDEDYQEAVGRWRKDVSAWQTEREEALATKITSGLDERLKRDREMAAVHARQETVLATIGQKLAEKPQLQQNLQAHAQLFSQITREGSPFIFDLIENRPDGPDFYADLAETPVMAQALVALPVPTRPLADAVRQSPSARALMQHFATEDGREDYLRLRLMHPVRVLAEIGRLEVALEAADRGSASSAPRPITSAIAPAKPPVGSPRARTESGNGAEISFEEWNVQEDARELAEKRKALGLSA